jgi:hypothetical protein
MPDLPRPQESSEFIARQMAVLDAGCRAGMNLIARGDDGRIVRIAPDGTETDVTAELDRRVSEAKARMRSPAP